MCISWLLGSIAFTRAIKSTPAFLLVSPYRTCHWGLIKCRFNVGYPSTLAQYSTNIGLTSTICWDLHIPHLLQVYIWILLYVAICTIMIISRHKEARSRDYALNLFRMTSRVLVPWAALYTPCLWTVWSTVCAQPRWQISVPTGIRTRYTQVTSPCRYEWAIGAGHLLQIRNKCVHIKRGLVWFMG